MKMKVAFNRSFWLYTLAMLIGFAVASFIGTRFDAFTTSFWVIEALIFLIGITYVVFLYRLFSWALPDEFWPGLVYLLVLLVGGAFVLALLFGLLSGRAASTGQTVLSVLPYALPYLFFQSYLFWARIPAKKYERWQYPVNDKIPIIELIEPIAIDFKLSPEPNREPTLECHVNAPRHKSLSTIVYYLLYDYNAGNPKSPIGIYADPAQSKLAGWVFQTDARVLDPAKSLKENQVVDGMVITARSFTD